MRLHAAEEKADEIIVKMKSALLDISRLQP
jgi:hypothetical protein